MPLGRGAGLTERQIAELGDFEGSDAYADGEKDVLRFTDQWTNRSRVADDVVGRLAATMSPADLVTLAATVAQANFTCRFNVAFGVELP